MKARNLFLGLCELGTVCALGNLSAADNLALGKPVTSNGAVIRGGDWSILTDGKKAEPDAKISYRDAEPTMMVTTGSSAEGWEVTIDLGEVYGIDTVFFPSATHFGVGGVATPIAVKVFMSDDGKTYRDYGNIAEDCVLDLPDCYTVNPPYKTEFQSRPLNGHGRYVKILARSTIFYYCDEIEVFGSKKLGTDDGKEVSGIGMGWDVLTRSGIKRRMAADLRYALAAVKKLPAARQVPFVKEADALRKRILEFNFEGDVLAGHLLSAPYNDLHRDIYALYGKAAQASGMTELVVTTPAEYDYQRQFVTPADQARPIVRKMMRNEERSAVIALFNAGGEAKKVSFSFANLPDGVITPMLVEYSDTFAMVPVASALMPLKKEKGEYELNLPAGMNTQLWLQINSSKLDAGTFRSAVKFSGALDAQVPLTLKVAPLTLPEQFLHEGTMWDYTTGLEYGVTRDNVESVQEVIRRYQISPCTYGSFPQKAYAEDISGSFQLLDEMRQKFTNAKRYHLFFCLNPQTTFAGLKPGTEEFKKAVADWAGKFRKGLTERNLTGDQVILQLLDEPGTAEQYQTLAYWAEAVMAGMPDARINWNPAECNDALLKEAENALQHCRSMMPRAMAFLASSPAWHELCAKYAARGHWFSLYDCSGPNHLIDPDYFRIPVWYVAKADGIGTNYWSLTSGCSWNEYLVRNEANAQWPILFLGKEDAQISKPLLAWQESRYDFAYIKMLQTQLKELKAKGLSTGASQKALDNALQKVDDARLARPDGEHYYSAQWIGNKTLNTMLNQIREELLPVLVANAELLRK